LRPAAVASPKAVKTLIRPSMDKPFLSGVSRR
jgi:hypothetical protein